jgi:lipoprotein-anchoring transpeptidase ErfK/SrfK
LGQIAALDHPIHRLEVIDRAARRLTDAVNHWCPIRRFAPLFIGLFVLAGFALAAWLTRDGAARPPEPARPLALAAAAPAASPAKPAALPDPQPPAVEQVLRSGVLIVISKGSQRMHVFKDGEPWGATPVSTGRRGHATPSGVFPILQKQVWHRSNKYSNAPMPYMQRLTWSGIAIHAGRLPGYAASHGCIRLPYGFARELYALTRASATTVVIASGPIATHDDAREFALALKVPPAAPATAGSPQTIQLAAVSTPAEADSHWARVLGVRPELARFRKDVVAAVVNGRRIYRLRASAPDARATCSQLKSAGIDCFNVI